MSKTSTTYAEPPGDTLDNARPRPRILVVDDEASMRDMLRIVLRRDGYDVRVAPDGRAALEMLKREPFGLLLSDIRMPDLSGVEVLRSAKEVNQDLIVFM